jgi:hypothetical protein
MGHNIRLEKHITFEQEVRVAVGGQQSTLPTRIPERLVSGPSDQMRILSAVFLKYK